MFFELFVIFLNIAFLGKLAMRDRFVYNVPYYTTLIFVVFSFCLTSPIKLLEGFCISLVMYLWIRMAGMKLGSGDRKIVFGLTLQLGWFFGVCILLFIVCLLLVRKVEHHSGRLPLIPVILVVYIMQVFYIIGTGALT